MKKEILSDALDEMSDDIIERTALLRREGAKRTRNILAWAAAFACTAALAVLIIAAVGRNRAMKQADNTPTAAPEQTTEAPAETAAPTKQDEFSPGEASMIAFFIYNGRQYRHFTSSLEGDVGFEKLGNQLGVAVMKIDEWSKQEDYTELSGSVGGPFYEIEGFDPNFVLGLSYMYPHRWSPFVCAEGLELEYGRDLYRELLHLDTMLAGITYESDASCRWSKGELYRLPADRPEIRALFAAANEAEIIRLADAANGTERMTRLYELHLELGNGLTAGVSLLDGGYLMFSLGSAPENDPLVRIPEEEFGAALALMEAGEGLQINDPTPFELSYNECVNDETLGIYLPEYVPENMRAESAELMRGEDGTTNFIMVNYGSVPQDQRQYLINISSMQGYEGEFVLTPEELTPEAIDKLIRHRSNGKTEWDEITVVLMLDGVSVELDGVDIDAETAYRILSSVRTDRP